MDSRFDADPIECAANGGHYWRDDLIVVDTSPELHTQYCTRCPAYRTRGGMAVRMEDAHVWSEPQVHPRN